MDIDGPGRRLLDLFHPLHCAWQNEVVHFADTGLANSCQILWIQGLSC